MWAPASVCPIYSKSYRDGRWHRYVYGLVCTNTDEETLTGGGRSTYFLSTSTCAMCNAAWTIWTSGRCKHTIDCAVQWHGRGGSSTYRSAHTSAGSMSLNTCPFVDTMCVNLGGRCWYRHPNSTNPAPNDHRKSSRTSNELRQSRAQAARIATSRETDKHQTRDCLLFCATRMEQDTAHSTVLAVIQTQGWSSPGQAS